MTLSARRLTKQFPRQGLGKAIPTTAGGALKQQRMGQFLGAHQLYELLAQAVLPRHDLCHARGFLGAGGLR